MAESEIKEGKPLDLTNITRIDDAKIGRGNPAPDADADVEGQQWMRGRWIHVRCPYDGLWNRIYDTPYFQYYQCWNTSHGVHYFRY